MDCRIVLVDDHSLFRRGLCGLLGRYEEFRIVGEAASGEEFLKLLPQTEVDVVLMDIALPGMDGIEATRRALAMQPDLKVVTLSMFGEEQYYSCMVEAGAKGFLLKDSAIDEVAKAIRTAVRGGTYFNPQLLVSLTSLATGTSPVPQTDESLSAREIEILACICQGLSNQEIADRLFISKRTVDKHRANILEKSGCRNTASLVVWAIRQNLVELP